MGIYQLRCFLLVVVTMLCLNVNGQNDKDLGSWNGLVINFEISDKINIFAESRLRAYAFYNKFYYYEFAFRANYTINNMFSVAAGTGRHVTYPTDGNFLDPVDLREIRVYEEVTVRYPWHRFLFDNRIRVDQRFTSDGYLNRYRYKPGLSIPLNHDEIKSGTVFLSFWDEVFLISDKPHLDLNRFFAGANYKLENATIQSGWVYQVSNDIIEKTRKNFFMITIIFEIHLNKE